MKRFVSVLFVISMTLSYAEFCRTTCMIDVPTTRILPHMGFRAGLDGSVAIGEGSRNDDADVNFHSSLGLFNRLEVYLDIYTISDFTAAVGFSHRILDSDKFGLAWGVHQLSYALDVSEIGHGDSTGWYDDLTYDINSGDYTKPFELGSAFIVATYKPNKLVDMTIGMGRGRYCGYGTHSQYFNSNFWHEEGGDWGIGLIAGIDFKINENISFLLEGDSRDLNTGFKFKLKPIEVGIALTKFEFLFWPDGGEFDPRIAASISYVKDEKKEVPEQGIIAGMVMSDEGNPLVANVSLPATKVDAVTTDPDGGTYTFGKLDPGLYVVSARSKGYTALEKKIEVKPGKKAVCNFTLARVEPSPTGIRGVVTDIKTGDPVVAQLTLMDTDKKTSSAENGTFEFRNLKSGKYTISAVADLYEPGTHAVEVKPNEVNEVAIKMVQKRTVITFQDIFFDFSKSQIKPEYRAVLDEAGEALISHPTIQVELQGHADSIGSEEVNMQLSIDRANAVRDYLMKNHQIDESRLSVHGYGETRPIAPNDTEENRAKNRRVDFVMF
jgi:outer membrane protein OmpA-like peptidoglycan-associated protein